VAFLREPRHLCCHKVKAVGSGGGGEGGERCVFFGKTMATAISEGTAVHSEAMGKGLGCLNASRALKAAALGPAALHGSLYPKSLLPTSARAHWASPTVPARCRGLQHAQQSDTRPQQFACHVATPHGMLPSAKAERDGRGVGWPGPPSGEQGCDCLSRANT